LPLIFPPNATSPSLKLKPTKSLPATTVGFNPFFELPVPLVGVDLTALFEPLNTSVFLSSDAASVLVDPPELDPSFDPPVELEDPEPLVDPPELEPPVELEDPEFEPLVELEDPEPLVDPPELEPLVELEDPEFEPLVELEDPEFEPLVELEDPEPLVDPPELEPLVELEDPEFDPLADPPPTDG
jgi:hypothetical protein